MHMTTIKLNIVKCPFFSLENNKVVHFLVLIINYRNQFKNKNNFTQI